MAKSRVALSGLTYIGSQRIYLADGTAIALNSTIQSNAQILDLSAETNNARYRIDDLPTLTTGVLIKGDTGFQRFYGYNGTSTFRFQRQTGVSIVQVIGYSQSGFGRA